MMTVADFWTTYRAKVVPPNASEAQVEGCKMAFYAGGVTLVSLIHLIDKSRAIEEFQAIENELLVFSATVGTNDAATH